MNLLKDYLLEFIGSADMAKYFIKTTREQYLKDGNTEEGNVGNYIIIGKHYFKSTFSLQEENVKPGLEVGDA